MFLNLCEDSNALSAILLAKEVITIIKIGVPIILIIMCAIDLGKQAMNPDNTKSHHKVLRRMIAAVSVFFIPTVITTFLDLVGTQNYKATECWVNANTATIEARRAHEKAEEEELIAARQAEQEQARAEREEYAAAREEIRKANLEKAIEAEKNNPNNPGGTVITDGTFLKETGKDGMVKVVDGKFYKPSSGTSGADGTKGSGDYGYVIFFFNRLKAFKQAAADAGYTINYSTSEYGAWRPYSLQQYYYNCMNKCTNSCSSCNLAATPGKSNHGWGIASDMSFVGTSAKYWAHDHAAEYGLKFNLCNNVRTGPCSEDWHIEPYYLSTYNANEG